MTPPIVVIGPSGCGKTTLARALADATGFEMVEGDDHHPPGNIARMASGQALSDEDRAGFLDSVGRALAASRNGVVASCSALRRRHRNIIRRYAPDALFVWPDVGRAELQRRLAERTGHFMPASLLPDQITTFEPPQPDENVVRLEGNQLVAEQVKAVLRHIRKAD
jgi:gluconokinase